AWVSFWFDSWIPEVVLAEKFPRVAAASSSPNARVSHAASLSGTWWMASSAELRISRMSLCGGRLCRLR
ncbi:unnamed protein product, partial [Linum tenue]